MPFVVGMNRSGTTLLRMMLDAHPDLTIPPETHFVPDLIKAAREPTTRRPESALEAMKSAREWGDFGFSDEEMLGRLRALPEIKPGPAVRTFYAAYTEEQGKPRWGEKTPTYVQKMKLIQRAIPEARFVHVIRDGRDVALSVLDRTVRDLTAGDIARRWQKKITKAREDSPKLDHYMEIRYEDLILDTEPVLRRVCEFIELPWDDALLSYHERSADRLQEMARALPAEGRAKELSRRAADEDARDDDEAAERRPGRALAHADERRAARRVRGRRRRPARPSSATRPAPTRSSGRRRRSKRRSFRHHAGGIMVSKWFASGQAVVSRQIRSALDELGHETFVLAKQGKGPRAQPGAGRRPGLGPARRHPERPRPTSRSPSTRPGSSEQLARRRAHATRTTSSTRSRRCARGGRADDRALRLGELRARGRRAGEGAPTTSIYSFTSAEQERYRGFGIESPLLTWGCHPELLEYAPDGSSASRPGPSGFAEGRTRSGSTSPARSWASASRSRRSSRPSCAPAATTCGC